MDQRAGDDDPRTGADAPLRGAALWRARARPFVKPVIIVVVSLLAGWIIIGLVGSIDWKQVAAALGRLQWWAAFPLLLALLVRQFFNAVPLSRFVPGLRLGRSMQNDVTANLIGTVAPPPSDVVLRVSMFKSWGIDPVDGMAGVTLNTLTFYVVRFIAPVIGLVVLIPRELDRGQVVAALTSALVAVGVLVTLVLLSRGERFADLIGRTAARVVKRFRSSVDPDAWAEAVVEFRGRMSHTLVSGLPLALSSLVVMVLTDAFILLMSLRLVGVGPEVLPTIDVVGGHLLAYPLTLMPLAGLGIMDAALVAGWTDVAGLEWEAEILAGLVVWRVVTLLGPLALGAVSLFWWRRHAGRDAGEIV